MVRTRSRGGKARGLDGRRGVPRRLPEDGASRASALNISPTKRHTKIQRTDLEVVPIRSRSSKGPDFLVRLKNQSSNNAEQGRGAGRSNQSAESKELDRLKRALATAENQMRSMMDNHYAAVEELRAAHEEILTSNEELQSANEELETAKDELEYFNEALSALNEKLQNSNDELSRTANDLNSLLNAVEIPVVILGNDLCVRRFTPKAGALLGLTASDVGRPIAQLRLNMAIADLREVAWQVIDHMVSVEHEVQDQKGHWYVLRMRPYLTSNDIVAGILMVLVDIHDLKQYSTGIVETMRGCLLVLDSHLRVILASTAFYTTFGMAKGEAEGQLLWELGNGEWDFPSLRNLLEKVLPDKKGVKDLEVQHFFPSIGPKTILLNARQLFDAGIGSPKILLVIEDITVRRTAENATRLLAGKLMTAKEDEDKKIARELHDSYGPRLAAVGLRVFEVERRLSSQPEIAGKLAKIRSEVCEIGKLSHDLLRRLHPAAVSQLGLETALEAECSAFSKLNGIEVRFSADGVPASLPEAAALCLYRVAEETLENVRKHSQSRTASVTLKGNNGKLGLVIQDFGQGFDLQAPRARKCGLGFVSMEERVRLVSGKLVVDSKPGEGTRVEVRIPLEGLNNGASASTAGG